MNTKYTNLLSLLSCGWENNVTVYLLGDKRYEKLIKTFYNRLGVINTPSVGFEVSSLCGCSLLNIKPLNYRSFVDNNNIYIRIPDTLEGTPVIHEDACIKYDKTGVPMVMVWDYEQN